MAQSPQKRGGEKGLHDVTRKRTSKGVCLPWPSTAIYGWASSLPLRGACFARETPLERTKFSFASDYQLGTAAGLGTRAYVPLAALEPSLVHPYACCLSL